MLFLAAACGPTVNESGDQLALDEFVSEHADLYCEIAVTCEVFSSESDCQDPAQPHECMRYDATRAQECLDALADQADELAADPSQCMQRDAIAACADALEWDDSRPGCMSTSSTSEGRPIRDGEGFVLPEVVRGGAPLEGPRGMAAEHWLQAARMEHASVAAFARLATELMAVAAPFELVAQAHEAALDEVRHAELCLGLTRELSAGAVELGRLPVIPARRDVTIADLAMEALLEGCIGEGAAAARALHAADLAEPVIAEVLRTIARDELRHAALSWRVIGWALDRDASIGVALLATLQRSIASHRRATPRPDAGVAALGVLSGSETSIIGGVIIEEIVLPTLLALLDGREQGVCTDRGAGCSSSDAL
jgi:hypothetical protein